MKTDFIKFSEIKVDTPTTWRKKKILSLDIDWAQDIVLEYVIDIIEAANVKCVFFITHKTPLLERIRKNKNFEMGIHPNFNPLLNNTTIRNADEILNELKVLVPEACVFRSHSLTTSGSFLDLYQKHGAKYLSNYMMNGVKNIAPFYQLNGIVEVPIHYADDADLYLISNPDLPKPSGSIEKNEDQGIKVYNFHPIHIALNCSRYEDYQNAKNEILTPERLRFYSVSREGIKNRLISLLNNYK